MSRRDPELDRLDAALRDRIEDLAIVLLGEPNKRLSSRREMRWGKRGSIKLDLDGPNRGLYVNYEDGSTGGGPLDMILNELALGKVAEAIDWAYGWLGWEKPRFNGMTTAERLTIEADIRNLLREGSASAQTSEADAATQPRSISEAAIAVRRVMEAQPAPPVRGRFVGLLDGVVDTPARCAEQELERGVLVTPDVNETSTVEEPFEAAPSFRKGEFTRDQDIVRLTVLVMGGDAVFQHEGYAVGEFSDMVAEAMDRAVASIARQIVADVSARSGKAGA